MIIIYWIISSAVFIVPSKVSLIHGNILPKGAVLIRGQCLFETWALFEEIRYVLLVNSYVCLSHRRYQQIKKLTIIKRKPAD